MNMAAWLASHPTMLTVHILPPTHELIADREEASAAASSGIEEVMVIIDRGSIVAVHTPPVRGYRFEPDDSWIRDSILPAWRLALDAVGKLAEGYHHPADELDLRAPSGWVLWGDLKSGDIATSGGALHGWVAISDDPDFVFSNGGMNARHFAHADLGHGSSTQISFKPKHRQGWNFYRVVRRGLTGEQILAVLEAVNAAPADEPVQATIDRVLPEAR